ncbi:hypothetical protein [Methanococcus sp. CF]
MSKLKTLFVLLILLPVTYAIPDDPDIFYGDVYLNGNLLNSGTLSVYVNGDLTDEITVISGSFGGPDILDEKLIASGYDGDDVTFSLDVSGYTINSDYTVYREDLDCGECIDYLCCQEYVKLEFSGSVTPSSGGGTTGGTAGGGSYSGGGGGITTTSALTSTNETGTSGSSGTSEGDSGTGDGSGILLFENETGEPQSNPQEETNDNNETGVVLQQESPFGGINLYLAMAAILLILIALAAAWYQSREKPEILPQQ